MASRQDGGEGRLAVNRREALAGGAALAFAPNMASAQDAPREDFPPVLVRMRINGADAHLKVDPRTTLLDALREHLHSPARRRAAITASAAPAR